MKGFVDSSIDFFSNYFFQIILVALIFLLIRGYLISRDIKFVDTKPHLEKVIVVESMGSNLSKNTNCSNNDISQTIKAYNNLYDNFCEKIKEKDDGGKEMCSTLKKKSCQLVDCCGWAFNSNSKNKDNGICIPVYLNNDTPEPKHTQPNKDALYYNNKLYNLKN